MVQPNNDARTAHPAEQPLERLGRYVLLERIAKGGMAEVFRAAAVGSAGFAKTLAIKRVLPHLAEDKAFIDMFIDEARIASMLGHPNILQVLDLGEVNGAYFIVMEYVAGASLVRVLSLASGSGHAIPQAMACHVTVQALEGLSFAHKKRDAYGRPLNIIHRDVSPQNIMVSFDGSVKLADFGIAKASNRTGQGTATGAIKGKPGYLAPEQLTSGEGSVDQRLDVYAMGVVLHEMLCMRRMRLGNDEMQVLALAMSGRVPKFEERGVVVAPMLADVVYRALEPLPENRYQSAEEFRDALQHAMVQLGMRWSASETADVMAQLFTSEITQEQEIEQRYDTLISRLAQQPTGAIADVDILLEEHVHKVQDDVGGATQVTQLAPGPKSRTPLMVAGAVGLALLAGGGWMAFAPKPGSLHVETLPAGAHVRVNGKPAAATSPVMLDGIPPGPVTVEVSLDGHEAVTRKLELHSGEATRLDFTLVATKRAVAIASQPAGASVMVDGKVVGTAPLELQLAKGAHLSVRAELAGHVPMERVLDDNTPAAVTLALVEIPKPVEVAPVEVQPTPAPKPVETPKPVKAAAEPPAKGNGKVTLQSEPWAKIYVDGKDTGLYTPTVDLEMASGVHTIRLANDTEGLSATFKITVVAKQQLRVSKTLH